MSSTYLEASLIVENKYANAMIIAIGIQTMGSKMIMANAIANQISGSSTL
jgi:hypothetical protein